MRGLTQGISAAIIACLVVVRWMHLTLWVPLAELWIESVMGTWEESIKSVIREIFAFSTRVVNGFFSWVVALMPKERGLGRRIRTRLSRSQAWQAWWAERRPSTFNAIVARHCPPVPNGQSSGAGSFRRRGVNGQQGCHDQRQPQNWISTLRSAAAALISGAIGSAVAACRWFGAALRRLPGWQSVSRGLHLWLPGRGSGTGSLRRRGSDLFDRPSGWAMSEDGVRRGFVEELCLTCEMAVTTCFDTARWLARGLLRVPPPASTPPMRGGKGGEMWQTLDDGAVEAARTAAGGQGFRPNTPAMRVPPQLRRSASFSSYEALHGVWTAKDVIQSAGYPMEPHIVTTSDGYIMQMERIPRKGARDVVFFMHGILDTSMGWVCNGVTGSSAFAAYDAGFDVWLGNSRANPPRLHMDPRKQGAAYWHYSVNELGMEDVAAQVDHIHIIKSTELTAGMVRADGSLPTRASTVAMFDAVHRTSLECKPTGMRRSNSELSFSHHMSTSAATSTQPYAGPAIIQPPNEAALRAKLEHEQQPRNQSDEAHSPSGQARDRNIRRPIGLHSSSCTPPPQTSRVSTSSSGLLNGSSRVSDIRRRPPSLARLSLDMQSSSDCSSRQLADNWHSYAPDEWSSTPHRGRPASSRTSSNSCQGINGKHNSSGYVGDSIGSQQHNSCKQNPLQHSAHAGAGGNKLSSSKFSQGSRKRAMTLDRSPSLQSSAHSCVRQPEGRDDADASDSSQDYDSPFLADGLSHVASDSSHDLEWCNALKTPSISRGSRQDSIRAEQVSQPSALRRQDSGTGQQPATGHGQEPYRLRAVGHSLGGASLLIYAAMCCRAGRPHHLYRLILLTPAGFLKKAPKAMWPLTVIVPPLWRLVGWGWPGVGAAAYVPSSLLRWLTFKVLVDLQQIPALNELTVAGLRMLMNGDSSQWDRALQMPHYNSRAMPAISFHTGVHLVQWARSGRFTLFDHGSPTANRQHYGQDQPLDVTAEYGAFNCPVDICAGRDDGIIARENVIMHFEAFRAAGANVSFKEFDFGHLDFTFAVKDELRHYVLARLLQRN